MTKWGKFVKFLRDNGLYLILFALFFVFLLLQSVTGLFQYNHEHIVHGISYLDYLGTGTFLDGIFKNWEAAALQLGTLILLGASLHQKGASHSRQPYQTGEREAEGGHQSKPEEREGLEKWFYEHSLSLAFLIMFAAFLVLHFITGTWSHNEKAELLNQPKESIMGFFWSAECWFQIFQTWQAEFFAIGMFVVLSVFLRQKGSAESKPVKSSNQETGTEE